MCVKSCNVEALVADLNLAPWTVMGSYENIDDCWEYSADSHIPMRKARVRAKPHHGLICELRKLLRAWSYYRTKARRWKNGSSSRK